jgi:antitoxin MazE
MSHVQKWGDTLAIRLPKAVSDQLGMADGTPVALKVEGDRLIVERQAPQRPTMRDLLAQCRPENRPETIDWGPPVGREFL